MKKKKTKSKVVQLMEEQREALGLTPTEVSKLLKVSRLTWHAWIRGDRHPRFANIEGYLEKLGVVKYPVGIFGREKR